MKKPVLYIVIPCYNEQEVLPVTCKMFLSKLMELIGEGKIHKTSRILFVNDGSEDGTWDFIQTLAERNEHYIGISQSRNRGHQNALLAGLMEAKERCDITISIDCDGQDDIDAMDAMLEEYIRGSEIVYGVRSRRDTDTWFKRTTAQGFYRVLNRLAGEVGIVYNHADYRLVSSRVLEAFSDFKEVNLFLRGMFPLVGFKSTCVYYERHERIAGESHYPLAKMLSLAFDGITSLTARPIRMIVLLGIFISLISFVGVIWSVAVRVLGYSVDGWASTISTICFIGGIQLLCIGVIGEYVGKIYMEVKARPRYIISERTGAEYGKEENSCEGEK